MSRKAAADHQSGPEGPIVVARRWLWLVLADGDLRQAWELMAPALRRTLTEAWVNANLEHPALRGRDLTELITGLATAPSNDSLWAGFAETQVREFQHHWSYVDLDFYDALTDPRPSGPDEEGVVFIDTRQPGVVQRADGSFVIDPRESFVPMEGWSLLMRYFREPPDPDILATMDDIVNGWRVAGFDYQEPVGGADEAALDTQK